MKTGKPLLIAGVPIAGLALHSYGVASAWSPPGPPRAAPRRPRRRPSAAAGGASPSSRAGPSSRPRPAAAALPSAVDEADIASLGLTPELEMMTCAFGSIPDEKTRHKQLLYLASKLPPVDDGVRVPENKVPGCLSTVHVDCSAQRSEGGEGGMVVNYVGDSDGLMTKGLLALLIRGLSGCTPDQINAVDPQFIRAAKISQTLTPGRNNGFLNMLEVMKRKAVEAVDREANGAAADGGGEATGGGADGDAGAGGGGAASSDPVGGGPVYNAVLSTLAAVLKPTAIRLSDVGGDEDAGSRFELEVVAEAFDGLDAAKRRQLVRMLLGDVMSEIRTLDIVAKSPSEA